MTKLRTDERYRLSCFYKIYQRSFCVAIQPTFSREYMGDMLTRASNASQRIGFEGDLSNITAAQKLISDLWYSQLLEATPAQTMELKRNAEFVRGLGLKAFLADIPFIESFGALPVTLRVTAPYIVIVPGASWVPKMWPISHFVALMKRLNDEAATQFVLCGSADEFALCQQLITHSGLETVKNFAGKTSLSELVEIIRHAQFVIANDTSSVHIAAATQTPAICLLGGGHYGRFLPYEIENLEARLLPTAVSYKMDCYQCNWNCKHIENNTQTVPCIAKIEVDKVVELYKDFIRG